MNTDEHLIPAANGEAIVTSRVSNGEVQLMLMDMAGNAMWDVFLDRNGVAALRDRCEALLNIPA